VATASWSHQHRWKILGLILLGLVVVGVIVLQYAVRGGFAATRPAIDAGGRAISEGANPHRIAGRVYLDGSASAGAPLVVVLHGDAPFRNPGYHYAFASTLSERLPGVPIAALLRPGFSDPYGARSDGRRGSASGDDYTRAVTHDLSDAIAALRTEFSASSVVLVGHSGGAAIAANIAAASPRLIDSLILVSCPCDVPAFRRHMARQQFSPFWLWPSDSESPLDTVDRLTAARVFAVTGEYDPIALVTYARAYTEAARHRGLSATLTVLPDRGHEILNDEAVIEFTRQRVAELIPERGGPQPATH
jgi:pimeloyl-ACP methyl ester carboxylesterase